MNSQNVIRCRIT